LQGSDPHTPIPEVGLDPFEKKAYLTTQVNSSTKDIIENALDPLHTHFVHGGFIRTDTKRQKITVKMRVASEQIEAEYCNEAKQYGFIHKILSFGREIEKSFGRYIHPSLFQIEFITTRQERLLINGFLSPDKEDLQLFLQYLDINLFRRKFGKLLKPNF